VELNLFTKIGRHILEQNITKTLWTHHHKQTLILMLWGGGNVIRQLKPARPKSPHNQTDSAMFAILQVIAPPLFCPHQLDRSIGTLLRPIRI
jgi:hypothetical protein